MIKLRPSAPWAWATALLLVATQPALAAPDIQAAKRVLDSAPVCQNLGDYYWEIGDAKGVIASGSKGTRVQARNPLPIASASKWIFGAFVVETTKGHLSPAQIQALEMGSGFDSFNPFFCRGAKNIEECLGRRANGHQDPAKVGVFNYNEGHDAKLAMDLGLGQLDLQSLALTWNATLNSGSDIHFLSPEPAGGLSMTTSSLSLAALGQSARSWRLTLVGIFLLALAVLAPGIQSPTGITGKDEYFLSLRTPLEMMEKDAWVVPVLNGHPRLKKPPMRDLARQTPWLKPRYLMRNYGQTAALQAGFDAATGRFVVTLDGDLQNDPADIPALVDQLKMDDSVDM